MNQSPENQYQKYLQGEDLIDIKKYIFLILSHWWWFALAIFISMTIAYLINRYSEKQFEAGCSVIIGEENEGSGSIGQILDELSRIKGKRRKAIVENEISILKSYKMTRMALEELNEFDITYVAVGRRGIAESKMYKNCPFYVVPDTSELNLQGYPVNIILLSNEKYKIEIDDKFDISEIREFGKPFQHPSFNFTVYLKEKNKTNYPKKYYFLFNNINSLANSYRGALNIEVNDEKGSILTLSMQGYVPEQITDYLNKLCEIYIRSNLEEKNQTSENSIKFIDKQLQGIVDSLEVAGLRLQQFRSKNKVIDISKEGSFLFEKMQDLQSEKATLDINSRYYRYLYEYIQKRTDYSDVVAPSVIGIQDPLLNKLVSRLNELNLQQRNVSLSVMENSPQLTIVNNEITNTRNALEENVSNLINTNEIAMAELNERIIRIEKEVQKLPGTERQLINIEREFTINDQIYTFLLEKRAEAGITKASNTPDNKILDIARPENAVMIKPNISMNYLIAFVLGGLIPFLLIIIFEYFNNKITDRKDIETITNVPILGSIGHNDKKTELPVFENPKSVLAESFRALRTNLQYLLKEKKQKIICVSSTISGEGKTFCAINLASIISMAGKKTLLISLDLRRPKVYKVFNINNNKGLSTYLINKSKQEEIIHETNINNLFVTNSGPVPPNPAELIETKQMQDFLLNAKEKYDYIIIDTPPFAIVTDALLLKDIIDLYILVIRHGYSNKQVLKLVDDLYNKKDFKNISILINDIHVKGYYGYQYRYKYEYGYSYGYYGKEYYEENEFKKSFTKKIKNWLKKTL